MAPLRSTSQQLYQVSSRQTHPADLAIENVVGCEVSAFRKHSRKVQTSGKWEGKGLLGCFILSRTNSTAVQGCFLLSSLQHFNTAWSQKSHLTRSPHCSFNPHRGFPLVDIQRGPAERTLSLHGRDSPLMKHRACLPWDSPAGFLGWEGATMGCCPG